MDQQENPLGEVICAYTDDEAIEDGLLMKNPRPDAWAEVNRITSNRWYKIIAECEEQNKTRALLTIEPDELLARALLTARETYTTQRWVEDDCDKDFFAFHAGWGGRTLLVVRNESGKLTMMLPEDY